MRTLLTIGFAMLLIACEDGDSSPKDSTIIIEAREMLEPSSRRLTFYCRTEEIYPCVNYPILTNNEISADAFKIKFVSVGDLALDLCFTALGPATTVIDLSTVPNGEYEIEFNNAGLRNTGILQITDTDIELLFGWEKGIEFVRPLTKRVPDKTYWGTIGYHVSASSTLADEFIQKFIDKGAMFNKQAPGHYFYYEINNSGDIVNNVTNSGDYFMKTFIFQYDGDVSEIKNIIQGEGANYKVDLSINLQTYKGEWINNWE